MKHPVHSSIGWFEGHKGAGRRVIVLGAAQAARALVVGLVVGVVLHVHHVLVDVVSELGREFQEAMEAVEWLRGVDVW